MKDIVAILQEQNFFRAIGPVTADQIKEAEQELGLKFSDEYRQYIKNLGVATFEGHEFTGICSFKRLNVVNVTKEEREYHPEIPSDWYVVEQLNIDGMVIWQTRDGSIYLNGSKKMADSLAEYVRTCAQ